MSAVKQPTEARAIERGQRPLLVYILSKLVDFSAGSGAVAGDSEPTVD